MNVKASTLVSFLTGRLYSNTPPTILFGELCDYLIGIKGGSSTINLSAIKDKHKERILNSLPIELKNIIVNWVHSDNWQERVDSLDLEFGLIEIK